MEQTAEQALDLVIRPLPQSSVNGIIFSFVLCIGLPIALIIYGKVKMKAHIMSAVIGAGCFMLFVMVIEGLVNNAVAGAAGDLINQTWFYAIYGGLAAGIFEETARFIAMRFLMKKPLETTEVLMYGFGHGGIEMFFAGGVTAGLNLMLSQMINQGQVGTLLNNLDDANRALMTQQLAALSAVESWQFYMIAGERIAALAMQIGLSYIVYRAVKEGGDIRFFILAILLHAAVDGGAVFLKDFLPLIAVEGFIFAASAAICLFAWWLHKNDHQEGENSVYM
ncbi:MAG: YhfC family intramembrane metalloprotease [Lachnospiraceae bacterium]|nr:YhfC family intramembrane metalloprotease [Lachnospiraceae bacterium]